MRPGTDPTSSPCEASASETCRRVRARRSPDAAESVSTQQSADRRDCGSVGGGCHFAADVEDGDLTSRPRRSARSQHDRDIPRRRTPSFLARRPGHPRVAPQQDRTSTRFQPATRVGYRTLPCSRSRHRPPHPPTRPHQGSNSRSSAAAQRPDTRNRPRRQMTETPVITGVSEWWEWSWRRDSNPRPADYKASRVHRCATCRYRWGFGLPTSPEPPE